ncbi:OmpA family protein [Flavobacterium sp. SM2513]|uniref:OmpA family protein n=1 Tax=Flavobacterium sp. SM2513 TaxID=3424766 RepID=UPI003D7FDB91
MKTRFLFYALFLIVTLPVWSQKLVQQGHQQFQDLAYSDAIISLEKAVEKGFRTSQIYSELADSYYFNANYTASEKWYSLLFKTNKKILPIHYFRFSQSLKSIGNYEEANEILNSIQALSSAESQESLKRIAKNSGRYQISLSSFNSATSDFGPSYFGDQIVFATARDTGSVFKRKHSWTNQSFTDLFVVYPDSVTSEPVQFSESIKSKFNESTAIFTKDGLTMYFTRNNFENNKLGTNANQTTLLKIYKAVKTETDWNVIGALPFCSDKYNVAHPALSPDEKTLYFASDMSGGYGSSDLYQVHINTDGTFALPTNLGSSINTSARETFPFVSQNNELYFASDGHYGLGGLDVFVSNFDKNVLYSKPKNVGEPVNSQMDDFGFIINAENKTGYFTSNRLNGMGMDDIYAFQELIPLPCETVLTGTVAMQILENTVSVVELLLLDTNLTLIEKCVLDEKGTYSFIIDCAKKYVIRTTSADFLPQEFYIEPTNFPLITLPQFQLKKQPPVFKIGDDVAKKLSIAPIYFDLGKSNIRFDAAVELEKIKKVLIQNPTLKIDIRSHTDSRDSFENNQSLSENRATATVNWFVENGIEANRLSGTGFGESQLLNNCSDGVPCSETDHQLNRRSEFIVTGI